MKGDTTMSVAENIRLDEQFIAAWNAHDADAALALLAEDVIWQDVGNPVPYRGKEAARTFIQNWFTAFPDIKTTVTNRLAMDDRMAVEIEFTGTNTGPLQMTPGTPAIPATGRTIMGRGTYFTTIRNGKATEVHTYPDAAGMMMQLGLVTQATAHATN
jgi:steroid delta-isomerase-like uncharacterized protein